MKERRKDGRMEGRKDDEGRWRKMEKGRAVGRKDGRKDAEGR